MCRPRRVIGTPTPWKKTERMGLKLAMEYERGQGRVPEYVGDGWSPDLLGTVDQWSERVSGSRGWCTCDIVSLLPSGEIHHLAEVKGKARHDPPSSIVFPDREYEASRRLGEHWWLYVAFGCDTPADEPFLVVVREPRKLTWRQMTSPTGEGGVEHEGRWSVMPSEVLRIGERV